MSISVNASANAGQWLAGLAIAAALMALAPSARGDGVPPPELGITWVFECDSKWNDRYTFKPASIEEGVLVIELTAGDKTGMMTTPLSALYTGFHPKKVIGNKTTKQVIETGTLSIGSLEVGEKVSAWVRQHDSRYGKNRWMWGVEITGKISVETKTLGSLEVYVFEQNRYSNEWRYGSKNIVHYAPKVNGPIYLKYSDNKGNEEECHLVSRE